MRAEANLQKPDNVMQQGIGVREAEALEKRSSFHCTAFHLNEEDNCRVPRKMTGLSSTKAVVKLDFVCTLRRSTGEGYREQQQSCAICCMSRRVTRQLVHVKNHAATIRLREFKSHRCVVRPKRASVWSTRSTEL